MKELLKNIDTKDLVEELKSRDGVSYENVEPHTEWRLSICGPAVILMVID